MLRQLISLAAVALFLLVPTSLLAGGPPWLCLPIDGVASDSAPGCVELLTAKLGDKLSPDFGRPNQIQLRQHAGQWYVAFYMGDDVRLSDVEAALKGSRFSVPREKLRLFGHVILEIEARAIPKELLKGLEAMKHVSVDESQRKKDLLLVTVDMPYPAANSRPEQEALAWDKFQRDDFASDPATRSESPATAEMLPSLVAFRDVVKKHDASLKDIRWSTTYACRALGGVVPASTVKAAAVRAN